MKLSLSHLPTIILSCFLAALGAFSRANAATTTVHIKNFAFIPNPATIHPGDEIMWVQEDSGTSHTSTSGTTPTPDGKWNSGNLSAGQTFSHTFGDVGTFPYYCAVHPSMTATIVVQALEANPPSVSITSPTNNSAFTSVTNITIAAAATGNGATITGVEFFDGAISLGTDASEPFSVTASLGAGTHTLTAKATDSNAASAVSDPVIVTVSTGGTRIDDPIPAKIAKGDITIELQTILDGLVSPLGAAVPDDGSGRMFVYDQIGLAYVLTNGNKSDTPLIDVRSRLVPLNPGYD